MANKADMAEPMVVVCHDAGGAELISHWIRRHSPPLLGYIVEGPARSIFRRVLGDMPEIDMAGALAGAHVFLAGSGWKSDLEWEVIREAKALGKKTICYLDHWVNYRERFVRYDTLCLPDIFWVADQYAYENAQEVFAGATVIQVGNPYLDQMLEDYREMSLEFSSSRKNILFVTEPISEHASAQYGNPMHYGYTELQALEFALKQLSAKGMLPPGAQLVVRPHPAEPVEKYISLFSADAYPGCTCVVRKDRSLIAELAEAQMVVGCNTMALVVAAHVGVCAVSCIPPAGRPCVLPHVNIERWR